MTLEQITETELKLAEIDKQIYELIEQRIKLVNPTPAERAYALKGLCDGNDIRDLMQGVTGDWFIADEVLAVRRDKLEYPDEEAK